MLKKSFGECLPAARLASVLGIALAWWAVIGSADSAYQALCGGTGKCDALVQMICHKRRDFSFSIVTEL